MKCNIQGGCQYGRKATHQLKVKKLGERTRLVKMCNQHAHFWWVKCMRTTVKVSRPVLIEEKASRIDSKRSEEIQGLIYRTTVRSSLRIDL